MFENVGIPVWPSLSSTQTLQWSIKSRMLAAFAAARHNYRQLMCSNTAIKNLMSAWLPALQKHNKQTYDLLVLHLADTSTPTFQNCRPPRNGSTETNYIWDYVVCAWCLGEVRSTSLSRLRWGPQTVPRASVLLRISIYISFYSWILIYTYDTNTAQAPMRL